MIAEYYRWQTKYDIWQIYVECDCLTIRDDIQKHAYRLFHYHSKKTLLIPKRYFYFLIGV